MNRGAGISRVAAEVVLLVIAVAVSLPLFSPVGQVITGAVHRAVVRSHVKYQLGIVSVNPRDTVPGYPWVPAPCRGGGPIRRYKERWRRAYRGVQV